MNSITIGKKYKTKDGRPVRILAVGLQSVYPVVGIVSGSDDEDNILTFTEDGRCCKKSCLDLVEILPYSEFKTDEEVMVYDEHVDRWYKRYFAGVNTDTSEPMAFMDGLSSKETDKKLEWDDCRYPTEQGN